MNITLHPFAKRLAGKRIGRLLAIRPIGRTFDGHILWECRCDCGKTKAIASNSLTRKNPSRSCGCNNKITATTREVRRRKNRLKHTTHAGYSGFVFKTKEAWSRAIRKERGDICQICQWSRSTCDVHHIIEKAYGGAYIRENAIVSCPNCHRMIHKGVIQIPMRYKSKILKMIGKR